MRLVVGPQGEDATLGTDTSEPARRVPPAGPPGLGLVPLLIEVRKNVPRSTVFSLSLRLSTYTKVLKLCSSLYFGAFSSYFTRNVASVFSITPLSKKFMPGYHSWFLKK